MTAPVPIDEVARALDGGLPDPPAAAHGRGLIGGELEALLAPAPAEDLRPGPPCGVRVPELRGAHPALAAGAVAHQVLVDRLRKKAVTVAGAQGHEHVQVGVMAVEGIVDAGDWSVDLSSPNKVLTVKADVPAEVIIAAVKEAGLKAALLEE